MPDPYAVLTIVVRSVSLDISRLINGTHADAGTPHVVVDGNAIVRLGHLWRPAGGAGLCCYYTMTTAHAGIHWSFPAGYRL